MDSVLQKYSDEEDDAITASLGLLAGMDIKGTIPWTNFKPMFSSVKYLKGEIVSNFETF